MRMRKAAKHLAENGSSLGAAMRAAGYSETIARAPSKITQSKTWQELMDEFLPESLLAQKHNELLHSDNSQAVSKGLEMGYKLRGTFAPRRSRSAGPFPGLRPWRRRRLRRRTAGGRRCLAPRRTRS